MARFDRDFFADAWRLTLPYWKSPERGRAYTLLAVVVALNLGLVYLNVLITEWYNGFYNALQHYQAAAFWAAIVRFLWLAGLFIAGSVYQTYLAEMLYIHWRRWLTTHYVEDWLSGRTHYRMQILRDHTDNPDQRIADDIGSFVAGVRHLSLGLLRAIVTLASFLGMLWLLSGRARLPASVHWLNVPGYLVWAALFYSVLGTMLTLKLGRPLIGLNFDQERYNADFRFGLVRVRENSESIAVYDGEPREQKALLARFASVFSNYWAIMKRQRTLNWFSSGYTQIAIIFPFLVAAPSYFSHAIEIGLVMQIASAFGQVQGALSYVVNSFEMLAQWHAVVDRLRGFRHHMVSSRTPQAGMQLEREEGPEIAVRDLSLTLPDGRTLLRPFDLQVPACTRLLLTGPSGSGKSTLLRTLAGIWPFGRGTVTTPPRARSLFLPQRPYLPLGTLREMLLYPHGDPATDSARLIEALRRVSLPALAADLDRVRPWSLTLSPGEQQRIAFARILIQRPAWVYLDEATSALDEAAENELYTLLAHELPDATVVSVGHRATLHQFHGRHLDLGALCAVPSELTALA